MKTATELEMMIAEGENLTLELKSGHDLNAWREAIVAFANDYCEVGGGTLLIGVGKGGTITGVRGDVDSLQQQISNICRDGSTQPPLAPAIYPVHLKDKTVIAVDVPQGLNRPYHAKGDCYIRVGSTTRKATFDETLELQKRSVRQLGEAKRLENSLPPRESVVTRFVGRQRELDALRSWVRDPASRRHVLEGAGGKGKSAIAYQLADEVCELALPPFEIVIWMSAKRRRFEEGVVVPIEAPHFWSLETALNKLLCDYGLPEKTALDLMAKREEALKQLRYLPALVVIDDVDSLEASNEDAIDFFAVDASSTPSKIMVTSRRQLFGWGHVTTVVEGFDHKDGRDFIQSRIDLFNLPREAFTRQRMAEILRITDGSPLYIEDLVRVCLVQPIDSVIPTWAAEGGDKAREFALGREFEGLSDAAKEILLACCLSEGSVSVPELEAITGFESEKVTSGVRELQRLFLMLWPKYIEGVERFDVNLNIRTLVRKVMGNSDAARRILGALRTLSGEQESSVLLRRKIRGFVRQALVLAGAGHQGQAEATLQEGLRRYANDADLLGQTGRLYKNWQPQARLTDARKNFKRSAQLKCKSEDMYWHWAQMEIQQQEWTKAAEAAEKGLTLLPQSRSLHQMAGYARSMLGRELLQELHADRAEQELTKSNLHFETIVEAAEHVETSYQSSLSHAFRGIALNYQRLISLVSLQLGTPREQEAKQASLLRQLRKYLELWKSKLPDDIEYQLAVGRLSSRFPS